jgi:arabinose-5-phosphate isomerase
MSIEESHLIDRARQVLQVEAGAIEALIPRLGEDFLRAVGLILACKGRVVVTGVGKSGAIGRKIASTLASTGTPAIFLHSSEGLHGDLGMVTSDDVLLSISYSGHSDDLLTILPVVRDMGVSVIALTGRPDSYLGMNSDVVLNVAVEREADPHNLAPTTSSTATLAMGDALAMAVMQERKFTREDFARFHPGGSLGKGLTLKVQDLMRTGDRLALADEGKEVQEVLFTITQARSGAAIILDQAGKLCGLVTDGDIRRHLVHDTAAILERPVREIMTKTPLTASPDMMAVDALRQMEERVIDDLPVVADDGKPVGLLDVQDLLRAGLL